MEEDINHLVIFAIGIVIMDELEEFPHLVFGNCLPCHAVIYHHCSQFKAEWVLMQHVIIHRHLERRSEDSTHRFDGAVSFPVLLQFYQKQLCIRCLNLGNLFLTESFLLQKVLHKIVIGERIRLYPCLGA